MAGVTAGYGNDARVPSTMAQQFSSCADTSTPTTFSVKGATYVKVLTWHFTTTPNSTQLAFEVVNAANGISIPCSLQNVEINGQWGDDSNYWYSCSDRSLTVDEKEYPVRTNAHIIWDDWKLTVNQTWDCGGEYDLDPLSYHLAPCEAPMGFARCE